MASDSIKTQYDPIHETYSQNRDEQDLVGNTMFHDLINFSLIEKKVLDVGCGTGADLENLAQRGAEVYGIDPSEEFLKEARDRNPTGILENGIGEDIPFENGMFDVVISKYALQTSFDVPTCLSEIARVLKSGGVFVLLCKHPLRQWVERIRDNGHGSNYYEQVVVTSNIFDGQITLQEPSHTITDYFNAEFFKSFEMLDYQEGSDFPASEQINGDIYPTFFLIKVRRK